MPQNGYWIECVPIKLAADTLELTGDLQHDGNHIAVKTSGGQYKAVFSSIPELNVVAQSPDLAIDMLRQKLRALSRYYRMTGRSFPERDNPVHPPKNLRSVQGWISVYVQFSEKCGNC